MKKEAISLKISGGISLELKGA